MFHIILEALIMLLLHCIQCFGYRWMPVCALKVVNECGTKLVPVVDGTLRQIDEPRSGHARQSRGQIVDHAVDLDELFGVTGAIILVDWPRLEFVEPGILLELGCKSIECAPP
jgi:hypothetical protein